MRRRLLLAGLAIAALGCLLSAAPASAAVTCTFDDATGTMDVAVTLGGLESVHIERAPASTTIRVQGVTCAPDTPTVDNTDLINVVDNGAAKNTTTTVDLRNGTFAGAGGQIDFDIDLNDGDNDIVLLNGENDTRNFRFGTFLGFTFVNSNAGTDNLQDMILRDVEGTIAIGGTGEDTLSGAGSAGTGGTFEGPLELAGNPGNDTVTGGNGNDELSGQTGNDIVSGGEGTDRLIAGPDDDTFDGGPNPPGQPNGDALDFFFFNTPVSASLATTAPQDTGTGIDTITGVERLLAGSGPATFVGNAEDNGLFGGDADDRLEGRGGDDQLSGGLGADTASYENAPAGVTVTLANLGPQATGDGTDTLSAIEKLVGSAQGDDLTGRDNEANELVGLAGDDRLEGLGGDDSLDGREGTDTASYANAAAPVTVSLADATPQNTGGAGIDTLAALENLTGSPQGDTLAGSPSTNVVSALAGDDSVQVRDGAPDTVDCGAGNDSVVADAVDNVGNCETVDNGVAAAGAAGGAGGAGAGAGGDTTLVASASANRVQDIVKQRAVLARGRCSQEACAAEGSGFVNVPRLPRVQVTRRFGLRPARANLPAGASRTLRLRLNRRTLARVRRALRRGKRVSATVRLTLRDAAGNTSRKTLRVRAKRIRRRR
jgi:Ca2+-binding RTX toxin-like protein